MNLFFGFLAIAMGAAALCGAVYFSRLRRRVLRWPTVPGTVIHRAVFQPADRGRMSSSTFRWAPDVRYTYVVNGKPHEGDKITLPWTPTSKKEWAECVLAQIPHHPDVRYDPLNPATSCLLPPGNSNIIWYSAAGASAILISLIWVLPAVMR